MSRSRVVRYRWSAVVFLVLAATAEAQDPPLTITPEWNKTVATSRTTATLQVVVNPPLRRGTPVHDNAFQSLHDLAADYVRFVPWLPYPRLGVAELQAPTSQETFWDFSLLDPITLDFLDATKGHPVALNFSIIPQWMFKTEKPVSYPDDPNQVVWNYQQGAEPRDPSFKEVADYYARLLSWYTTGGFTDELGKFHESGHHYSIPFWEVLNEVDFEHQMKPETYTTAYDAIVTAMRKVEPHTKFIGLALAAPSQNPAFFEYFLNPKNHRPGVPIDYISYHFYAIPTPDETLDIQQHTVFAHADGFLNTVRYVEAIRKRLSPNTETMINEIGIISADDGGQGEPGHVTRPIPGAYWNLAGAEFAYLFGQLTEIGIEVAGESQLVGYPTQFPSVSMVDWNDGKPNARFWVLKLLKDNFGPGDKLVEIAPFPDSARNTDYLYALAVLTKSGKRKLLLVNKRNRDLEISVPGGPGAEIDFVDATTGSKPPATTKLAVNQFTLHGFSVAVVALP
jgi:hypothetical protein